MRENSQRQDFSPFETKLLECLALVEPSMQQFQVLQPLVPDHLTARETTDRDNHRLDLSAEKRSESKANKVFITIAGLSLQQRCEDTQHQVAPLSRPG